MKQVTYDRIELGDGFFAELEVTKTAYKTWTGNDEIDFKTLTYDYEKNTYSDLNYEVMLKIISNNAEAMKEEYLERYKIIKEVEDKEYERLVKIAEACHEEEEEEE